MSPLALAALWGGCGLLAAALLPIRRRRRAAWLAPAAAALAAPATTTTAAWPGLAAHVAGGGDLVLGRPGLGLLVGGGLALALALALAPRLDGGEVLTACLVGAASVVALSATVPVVWALALVVAVGALTVRWVAASPGMATLAAGRVTGVGAAALVAAGAFVPVVGAAVDTRTALEGGLLAGGVAALLGLMPLGGWLAAAATAVRGVDLAPWAVLLAPAVLLSAGNALPGLPSGARTPLANVLLVLGLATALFGGVVALLGPAPGRYARVLGADLALAAAGLGCTHAEGRAGVLLLVLTHLCAAPLLLHPARHGLERQRRLAWLALSGLPPTPAFWGRLLVLEGLAATAGTALVAGLAAGAALLGAAALTLTGAAERGQAPEAPVVARALAWGVALALLGVGLAPSAIAGHVFGSGFGVG